MSVNFKPGDIVTYSRLDKRKKIHNIGIVIKVCTGKKINLSISRSCCNLKSIYVLVKWIKNDIPGNVAHLQYYFEGENLKRIS